MEHIRLENISSTRLRCLGWSNRAAYQATYCIAKSTLQTYNNYIGKFDLFCKEKQCEFSNNVELSVLADFLCELSDSSERPESVLGTATVAITFFYHSMGKDSSVHNLYIKRLIKGLIKTGTRKPMARQKPMPIQAFRNLFHHMGPNEQLSISDLRMKTITLMALVFMTRPSDLAPKAHRFFSSGIYITKGV